MVLVATVVIYSVQHLLAQSSYIANNLNKITMSSNLTHPIAR